MECNFWPVSGARTPEQYREDMVLKPLPCTLLFCLDCDWVFWGEETTRGEEEEGAPSLHCVARNRLDFGIGDLGIS